MVNVQVDVKKRGIWRYYRYFPKIEEKFYLSLGEGSTPNQKVEGIYFKREDFNPTGSFKDRGLSYQISKANEQGINKLVISSSGNAAISAAAYCQLAKISLKTFVSSKINPSKIEEIKKFGSEVIISQRPLSDSIKFSKQNSYPNLRPSGDPLGTEGYKTIAFELFQEIGQIDDIFLPVSSATALIGIYQGFKILDFLPRVHACQSTKVFPIAAKFDNSFQKTSDSLATALIAKVTPRKNEALEVINQSRGFGWVIADKEILEAQRWLEARKIITSAEGALALAAIWKAQRKGFYLGKTVCLLTGKRY